LNNLIQSEVSSNEDADASSLILEIWDNKNNTKNIFSSLNTKNNDTLNSISTDDHILLSNDNNKYNSLFTIDKQRNTDKQSNINLDIPVYHNQVRYNVFLLYIYFLVLFLFIMETFWKHINIIINMIKIIFLKRTNLTNIYIYIYIYIYAFIFSLFLYYFFIY